MARYPDVPRPISPYTFRIGRPFIGGGPSWAPQNRGLTRFNLCEADLSYRGKSWTDIMILYNFWESVHGCAGRFTFVDFNGIGPLGGSDPGVSWAGLFVAKADGITLAWDLPTFGISTVWYVVGDTAYPTEIEENGVAKTTSFVTTTPDSTKKYNIKVGAGTDGVDLVTATASLSTVATAPIPATSGTSLVVHAGDGAGFPSTPFNAIVWPTAVAPTAANAEIVSVTTRSTDTLTIARAVAPAYVRTIIVGDQIAVPPAASVIVTVSATCRRAFRRARFSEGVGGPTSYPGQNPFTYNVPANYYQGPLTIVEVRR
jgi:hypothetical protein